MTVKAEDDDYGLNAAIDYTIVSGAHNTFDIDISSGVVTRRSGAVLDFDIRHTYNIVVGTSTLGLVKSRLVQFIYFIQQVYKTFCFTQSNTDFSVE